MSNLVTRITADTVLNKNVYSRLKEPMFKLPMEFEDELKSLGQISSSEKGVLVSKVTTPEDYQTQMLLLSSIQHSLDRVHDITTTLYAMHNRWMDLQGQATRIIMMTYFDDLNALKDGVRKTVMGVALQPVQMGVDRLQSLIDRGESTYKHLMGTNWNVKEGVSIIKEYLSPLKYGTTVPNNSL